MQYNQSLLLLFFLFISTLTWAQNQEICGSTVQAHEQMMEENEDYKKRIQTWKKLIAPIVKARNENKNPNCIDGPLLIPIAIHFETGIVPAGQEACAIEVAIDHITELNREFAGLDVDAPLINQFASCFGANILGNSCMEFCIANLNHPTGYGLVDGDYAVTFGQVNFSIPGGNFTPVNSDWDEYVNIYVDNLPGGLLGVSNGIPGSFNGDGVMIDNCIFGTGNLSCPGAQFTGSAGCFATADEGEVLAHELGHYFGLFHIWGDNFGCTGAQDQIADTPDMAANYSSYTACGSHSTCTDLPQTCGSEDMYMNFMSYAANSCMYMFTSDQSDVMNATAVVEGYNITSSKCGEAPIADFSPDGSIDLCQANCITYTDLSENTPTIWDWRFEVTSGDLVLDIMISNLVNPTICLTSGSNGVIKTTLVVTNSIGSDVIVKNLSVIYNTLSTTYADTDNDGYGDPNSVTIDCIVPPGNVANSLDCDDTDPTINPAASELCDGIDNNCNNMIDEGLTLITYYADNDNDTFGDSNNTVVDCSPPSGYVSNDQDCDDTNPTINPNAAELCDGVDNNCNGNTDEGCVLEDCDGDYLVINNITQNTYRAEINTTSNALLNNGQSILFTAGTDIDLMPNFEVASGTIFEAMINPCLPLTIINEDDIVSLNLTNSDVLSPEVLSTFSKNEALTIKLRDKNGNEVYTNHILRGDILSEIDKATSDLTKGFYMISIKSKSAQMGQRIVIIE